MHDGRAMRDIFEVTARAAIGLIGAAVTVAVSELEHLEQGIRIVGGIGGIVVTVLTIVYLWKKIRRIK